MKSDSQLRKLTQFVLQLDIAWLAVIILGAILSTIELSRDAEGAYSFTIRVSTVTVILIALVWLPAVVRLMVLAGGGVKTPAIEATSPGLMKQLAESSAELQQLELQLPTAQRHAVERIRKQQERELASLSESEEQARQWLMDLAREYEQVRLTMPSSPERTSRMGTLVAQIRAFATRARYTPQEIVRLFETDEVGKRIVAIGTLQAIPYPECFDIVLQAIKFPKSAHEQYHALRAAEAMLPKLNADQERQLAEALRDQRSKGTDKYITPESDRWAVSERILEELEDTTTQCERRYE